MPWGSPSLTYLRRSRHARAPLPFLQGNVPWRKYSTILGKFSPVKHQNTGSYPSRLRIILAPAPCSAGRCPHREGPVAGLWWPTPPASPPAAPAPSVPRCQCLGRAGSAAHTSVTGACSAAVAVDWVPARLVLHPEESLYSARVWGPLLGRAHAPDGERDTQRGVRQVRKSFSGPRWTCVI